MMSMSELPTDIAARIDGFVSAGYESPEVVLREALSALEQRDSDLAAVREGIADEAAGRVRPAREVMQDLRSRHGLDAS